MPGEDFAGIYTAAEYLKRVNLMEVRLSPKCGKAAICGSRVCILGGGNVAMDAARTAVRLGADEVKVVYRRSRAEIPACAEEVHDAEEEGVLFELLTAPIGFEGDEQDRIRRMLCERMELGVPDDSGRRQPRPVAGSTFAIETDLVIVAIGYRADPLVARSTPNLAVNRWGYIQADERGRTNKRGVWSGGDIVTGAATVIQAMGAGRRAASDMHEWLMSGGETWQCSLQTKGL